MNTINKLVVVFIIASMFSSCNSNPTNDLNKANPIEDSNYILIADTIINDVVIKNPDKDEWTDYCLRNLDKNNLVNELFELVYSGKLVPYNFFHDTPMTIKEVKEIENEPNYSRDNVAKVQFEESWNFDSNNQKMMKKVHSIMIAYELYTSEGKVKGYKPIFKVYFN